MRKEVSNLYLVLGAVVNGKPNLTVALSDDLAKSKNLDADKIIRELAKEIKGGGGGQAFYATAGGSNSEGIANALEKAQDFVIC